MNIIESKFINNKNNFFMKIPNTIIQTFKTNKIPDICYQNILKIQKLNPNFNYEFFDDKRCRDFLKNNYNEEYTYCFDILQTGAAKADFFRLCYILKKGGVYIDIDFKLKVPINSFVTKEDDLVSLKTLVEKNIYARRNIDHSFLASIPNHPLIKLAVKNSLNNIKYLIQKKINYKLPQSICGPTVLGNSLCILLNRKKNKSLIPLKRLLKINNKKFKVKLLRKVEYKNYFINKYDEYFKEFNRDEYYTYKFSFLYEKALNYIKENNIKLENFVGDKELIFF